MVLRPLSSDDAVVVFLTVDFPLSDEVTLSTLGPEYLESMDVFLVESSAVGEKTPLVSTEGVLEDTEENSRSGVATASPAVLSMLSLASSVEDLRMTTVELRHIACRGDGISEEGLNVLSATSALTLVVASVGAAQSPHSYRCQHEGQKGAGKLIRPAYRYSALSI
jgi:hypothetical protein